MKFLAALTILLSAHCAQASNCTDAWKQQNKKNKVLESCELEWTGSGIELVRIQKGCAFPGPKNEPCFILRSCGREKEIGASVFRQSTPLDSYCIGGLDVEAMGASSSFGGRAHILCGGQKTPQSLRLTSPDGKLTKVCKFPVSGL